LSGYQITKTNFRSLIIWYSLQEQSPVLRFPKHQLHIT
jgi:hypothetical protein